MDHLQRTIETEVTFKGVGLHTARNVSVTFKPAETGAGISFIRVDVPGRPIIRATLDNLMSSSIGMRRSSLCKDDAHVHTIEHLMATLSGIGIDNLYIEVDGEELPGLDGSGVRFLELLTKAGIKTQDRPRDYYLVKEPIFIEEDGAYIMVLPAADFKIAYTLSYHHPLLKAQFMEIALDDQVFRTEIAPARTFCLEEEAEALQKQGIGQGANYENTLVVGASGVIKNKLRFEDEFVRHKILDLLGDLYIFGQPIKGHVLAAKSGHSLNLKLVRRLDLQRQRSSSAGIRGGYQPKEGEALDINMIKRILPHREPFLFVDKILSLEMGKRAVGIKNVTINDYFFKGHFPEKPVMPGVLIVEAMAQVGGVMMLAPQENQGKLAFFMAIDNVKFRKTVVPGDQLVLDITAGKIKSKTGQVHGKAMVDGKIVAEADLMFVLVEE
ncbi:MAG TPA: bifunctional UDP-3-O-[3-hydroxymyristoyl] N-acetylglucosamine deacetylase/3-hydroxyacyl-ACP dehydratase [Patescibacteria group bacterium]|nr:bifunctional UDP-3-O-[3-hydroxymyristoyl] N-acetylglucosamine deacetylase/3-hydroxyacyl-ACP dehydratase [Patescibacteria group bacterium]